jgi:glycerol kinase
VGSYLGAIDQGTTSTRFAVFDRGGRLVASAQQEHAQIFPGPGWVEHDAEEIWRRTAQLISQALEQAALRASDLAAVGLTNQRETTVVWNRQTGQPVSNAIVWQDARVAQQVAHMAAEGGPDRFRAQTGLPLSPYFSALKLRWILDHVPGVREQAEAGEALFGTMDTFLAWRLTGEHITDVTNASRTQLFHLERLDWDPELLAAFDVPRAMLPRVVASSGALAEIRTTALAGVPLAGILGDQQAALLGQACFDPGEAKNTYGTGCFLLMNTGERPAPSRHGLLTTVAFQRAGEAPRYALEGSVAIAGALVQWLRDNLGVIASSAADNGGVYFVPAFSGLYAPYWNDAARGLIAGLTRYATKAHLARAALEATAFQTRDVVAAMERDSGVRLASLRVDGGMVSNELLMQFQADILDRAVVRPAVEETTALGAAYAAGLGVGFYRDLEDLRANWRVARTWTPRLDAARREDLYAHWRRAVERSLDWIG